MTTLLKHGINIHDSAEGSIVQSVEVEAKEEESNVPGMKSGRTEIVKTFTHSRTNDFTVTGKGDLTLDPGNAAVSHVTLLTGGVTNILSFKYTQKIGEPSEWSYSGHHYPQAA